MEWLVALIALALMEIILGIDNLVFIAIVTARLPREQRPFARRIGLAQPGPGAWGGPPGPPAPDHQPAPVPGGRSPHFSRAGSGRLAVG